VKRNNAEDEHNGKGHDHHRVDFEARGLISVQPCNFSQLCYDSNGCPSRRLSLRLANELFFILAQAGYDLLSIVLELPPAPAALVLLGRRLAVFSARSAAAFLRMTVAGLRRGRAGSRRARGRV
jgi:hypothetical protein